MITIPKDLLEVPITVPELQRVLDIRKKRKSISKRIESIGAKADKLRADAKNLADEEGTILANADDRRPVDVVGAES